jgi:hypothetical protein
MAENHSSSFGFHINNEKWGNLVAHNPLFAFGASALGERRRGRLSLTLFRGLDAGHG